MSERKFSLPLSRKLPGFKKHFVQKFMVLRDGSNTNPTYVTPPHFLSFHNALWGLYVHLLQRCSERSQQFRDCNRNWTSNRNRSYETRWVKKGERSDIPIGRGLHNVLFKSKPIASWKKLRWTLLPTTIWVPKVLHSKETPSAPDRKGSIHAFHSVTLQKQRLYATVKIENVLPPR